MYKGFKRPDPVKKMDPKVPRVAPSSGIIITPPTFDFSRRPTLLSASKNISPLTTASTSTNPWPLITNTSTTSKHPWPPPTNTTTSTKATTKNLEFPQTLTTNTTPTKRLWPSLTKTAISKTTNLQFPPTSTTTSKSPSFGRLTATTSTAKAPWSLPTLSTKRLCPLPISSTKTPTMKKNKKPAVIKIGNASSFDLVEEQADPTNRTPLPANFNHIMPFKTQSKDLNLDRETLLELDEKFILD